MKNKGITLISLTITVIILLIIAGITLSAGSNMIKKANLEKLKTDMLLIRTKGKEYVENANFKLGPNIDTAEDEDKTEKITNAKTELKGTELEQSEKENLQNEHIINTAEDTEFVFYYDLTTNGESNYLEEMGIKGVESSEEKGKFIIKYDIKNMSVEVYNTLGYKEKYSLTEIDEIEE